MDKPLAASVEEAHAIAEAAEKSAAMTQMFTQVTTSWARAAKSAIESGQVGEVLALHCDMLMAKGKPGSIDPGVVRRERPSDGRFTHVEAKRELFDMGVYPVALVQWLSGARARTVYGITGNYFFKEHAELDIEDFGALALTLDSGQVASITSGRIGFTSHPRGGLLRITLIGENGIFTFSESAPYIEVYNDQPPFEMPLTHPFDPMSMWASTQREMQHMPKDRRLPLDDGGQGRDIAAFVDCVESGERPQVTVKEAAHNVEVIMAGYESAATGGPVDIG
jgi:predicted dehydrogenase